MSAQKIEMQLRRGLDTCGTLTNHCWIVSNFCGLRSKYLNHIHISSLRPSVSLVKLEFYGIAQKQMG